MAGTSAGVVKRWKLTSAEQKSAHVRMLTTAANVRKFPKTCVVCNCQFLGFRKSYSYESTCAKQECKMIFGYDRGPGTKYHVTFSQIAELLLLQKGRCKVCGDEFGLARDGRRRFHIDHDHQTGKFRGILCKDCNQADGFLHGDPERCRRLALYLEESRNG